MQKDNTNDVETLSINKRSKGLPTEVDMCIHKVTEEFKFRHSKHTLLEAERGKKDCNEEQAHRPDSYYYVNRLEQSQSSNPKNFDDKSVNVKERKMVESAVTYNESPTKISSSTAAEDKQQTKNIIDFFNVLSEDRKPETITRREYLKTPKMENVLINKDALNAPDKNHKTREAVDKQPLTDVMYCQKDANMAINDENASFLSPKIATLQTKLFANGRNPFPFSAGNPFRNPSMISPKDSEVSKSILRGSSKRESASACEHASNNNYKQNTCSLADTRFPKLHGECKSIGSVCANSFKSIASKYSSNVPVYALYRQNNQKTNGSEKTLSKSSKNGLTMAQQNCAGVPDVNVFRPSNYSSNAQPSITNLSSPKYSNDTSRSKPNFSTYTPRGLGGQEGYDDCFHRSSGLVNRCNDIYGSSSVNNKETLRDSPYRCCFSSTRHPCDASLNALGSPAKPLDSLHHLPRLSFPLYSPGILLSVIPRLRISHTVLDFENANEVTKFYILIESDITWMVVKKLPALMSFLPYTKINNTLVPEERCIRDGMIESALNSKFGRSMQSFILSDIMRCSFDERKCHVQDTSMDSNDVSPLAGDIPGSNNAYGGTSANVPKNYKQDCLSHGAYSVDGRNRHSVKSHNSLTHFRHKGVASHDFKNINPSVYSPNMSGGACQAGDARIDGLSRSYSIGIENQHPKVQVPAGFALAEEIAYRSCYLIIYTNRWNAFVFKLIGKALISYSGARVHKIFMLDEYSVNREANLLIKLSKRGEEVDLYASCARERDEWFDDITQHIRTNNINAC